MFNSLHLSLYVAESNSTFCQVTVVEPLNVTNAHNIYRHWKSTVDEFYYDSTVEKRNGDKRQQQTNQKFR